MNQQKFDFALAATIPIFQKVVDGQIKPIKTTAHIEWDTDADSSCTIEHYIDSLKLEILADVFCSIFLKVCEEYDCLKLPDD